MSEWCLGFRALQGPRAFAGVVAAGFRGQMQSPMPQREDEVERWALWRSESRTRRGVAGFRGGGKVLGLTRATRRVNARHERKLRNPGSATFSRTTTKPQPPLPRRSWASIIGSSKAHRAGKSEPYAFSCNTSLHESSGLPMKRVRYD